MLPPIRGGHNNCRIMGYTIAEKNSEQQCLIYRYFMVPFMVLDLQSTVSALVVVEQK